MASVHNSGFVSSKNYGKVVITLENCLLSEEKVQCTPSQLDGLDRDHEMDLRMLGCELIQTAGILLRLPQTAMATGQVLLHRFYYSKSLIKYPLEITAMAAVVLASKIEEAPRRNRDVINVFNHIKQVRNKKSISPVVLDGNYVNLKNQVIKAERRILKELGFCVHVQHPHKMIVVYLRFLNKEGNRNVLQYAWNAMNDLLRTDVFTRHSPETVAAACILLAARVHRVPLPSRPHWYEVFGMETGQLTEIAESALQLYRRTKPNAVALERTVDDLRLRQARQRGKPLLGAGGSTPQQGTFSPIGSRTNSPHGKVAGTGAVAAPTAGADRGQSPAEPVVLAANTTNGRPNNSVSPDRGADKENMAVKVARGRADSGDDVSMIDSDRLSAYTSPRDHDVKSETRNKLASYYRHRERYRSRSPSPRRHRDPKPHKKAKDRRNKKRDASQNGKSRYRSRSRSLKRSKSSRRDRDRSRSVSLDRHYKSLSSRKRHVYDAHSRR